ncbi:hypothetical protein D3C87_1181290 [compost metagenome]
MEKALRGGAYLDKIAIARHIQPVERSDRAARLTMNRAESGKIVPADEHLCSFMHAFVVQIFRYPPCALVLECQPRFPANDAVQIMAAKRGEARVEILGHRRYVDNRDGLFRHGQMGVESIAKLIWRPIAGKIDMGYLSHGMHAGIGAASAANRNGFAGQRPDGSFKRALN